MGNSIDHNTTAASLNVRDAPAHLSTRLLKELKILTEDAKVQSYFRFESSGQDAVSKKFCIYGYLLPRTEPYNHGAFKVRITLPEHFPYQPPELQLLTPIYHPAIQGDVSKPDFCCNCCSSTFGTGCGVIRDVIKFYVNIIDRPDHFHRICDYNPEARRLYQQNRARYEENAREMVSKYAYPRPN
jgi:ubiquitin-conjugating enzyme E2 D/E